MRSFSFTIASLKDKLLLELVESQFFQLVFLPLYLMGKRQLNSALEEFLHVELTRTTLPPTTSVCRQIVTFARERMCDVGFLPCNLRATTYCGSSSPMHRLLCRISDKLALAEKQTNEACTGHAAQSLWDWLESMAEAEVCLDLHWEAD